MARTIECAISQRAERREIASHDVSPAAVAKHPSAAYVSATSEKYAASRLVAKNSAAMIPSTNPNIVRPAMKTSAVATAVVAIDTMTKLVVTSPTR
jgi:hypothetical protein